jgi:hypothetical protein
MNNAELQKILAAHKEWLDSEGKHGIRANLSDTYLRGADLRGADLRGANLRDTYLRGADLRDVDIDFACWPLWCGSNHVKVDRRIAAQLAAHFCVLDCDDEDYQAAREALLPFARTSHRASDLGLLAVGYDE